jgi:6-phosphogluconolactonase
VSTANPTETDFKPQLKISESAASSAQDCADFVVETAGAVLSSHPRFTFAISGGSTPKLLFERLAVSGLDWTKVHVFWVDERCVPPDHQQSNFKLANDTWLRPAGVPTPNIHRVKGELQPDQAAQEYVDEIRAFFSLKPNELPIFDLIHRGMGPDAHTASLFPGEPLIANRTDIAAHVWVEKMKMDRVTLLPGVLEKAKHTMLEIAGADKAQPAYDVLYGEPDPFRFPCQIATRGFANAVWFLDEAAAAKVKEL